MENSRLFDIPGNEENLEKLIDLAQTKRLVPFLGAGFSMPACPGWGAFLDDFFESLKNKDFLMPDDETRYMELKSNTADDTFEKMADFLQDKAGRRKFGEEMNARFNKILPADMKQKFQLLHKGFRGLKITTNFDCLIENSTPGVHVCFGYQEGELERLFTNIEQNSLLKIHGCLRNIPAVVLSASQFETMYGHPSSFDPEAPLPRFLKRVFENSSVLFLGCSLVRDRVIKIMEKLQNMRPHYAVMRWPGKKEERVHLNRYLSEAGIYPIWITNFKQIEIILEMLVEPPRKIDKQIKILSITASPKEANFIRYELEQDALLKTFKSFNREEVFLDMPDPVKSTLEEIEEWLTEGKHDILHITAHGSINRNDEGVLALENRQGGRENVTGLELVNVLKPKPRIVILSACHSASKKSELIPVAEILKENGIDVVIGMKKKISHQAAVDFNKAFFQALCIGETVEVAFNKGRQAIEKGENSRRNETPEWEIFGEKDIPQLLADEKSKRLTREDFSAHRIDAPGPPGSHIFGGAKYLERGFIGRRQVLREIYGMIEDGVGAVVLKGPGGIGKSTLTTRVAANLRRQRYGFIVIRGETSMEEILEKLSEAASSKGIKEVKRAMAINKKPLEKLSWLLENFLLKHKIVIIFDNFEMNQEEKSGDFLKSKKRLKRFLWKFREWLENKRSVLLFSTRYRLPGFDTPGMQKDIPEFSEVEFRKMMLNSSALKQLDGKSVKVLIQEVGGNPRALELLDKIAYKEFWQRGFSWQQLKKLMPELERRIINSTGPGDDFTPLFLDRLTGYLSNEQFKALNIFSIFHNPVPEEVLAADKVSFNREDRDKLTDLSLLEWSEAEGKDLYYVHRMTARYLAEKMKEKDIKRYQRYHSHAAQYLDSIVDKEGNIELENVIESRWHYLRANKWKRVAELTFELEEYLSPRGSHEWAMELLLELDLKKLKDKPRSLAHRRIGILYDNYFNQYHKAMTCYKKALEISRKIEDVKNEAGTLHQIGNNYYLRGRYDKALRNYQQSLDIREKINDKKGIAGSLHQIAMIHQVKNDYDTALDKYKQSLAIRRKSKDKKGIAESLYQIGMIYHYKKKDLKKALNKYEEAVKIFQESSDIVNTAIIMYQMGLLYIQLDQYEVALENLCQAHQGFGTLISSRIDESKEVILYIRQRLSKEKFEKILMKYGLSADEI
jgi:tetratricopeptide (TPR) repeat protein